MSPVRPEAFGQPPSAASGEGTTDPLEQAIRDFVRGQSHEEKLLMAGTLIGDQAKKSPVSADAPKTPDELWQYIKDTWNIEISRVSVCPDHDAPFDFIWLGFSEAVPNLFCIGPRGGGKSFDTALLMELNSRFKAFCESMVFGAVDDQNKKVYDDMVEVFINGGLPEGESEIKGQPKITETVFKTGAKVRSYPACLTKNSKVVTPSGPVKISTIVSNKLVGPVRSYNFKAGRWEWKQVIGWSSQESVDSWLKLRIDFPTPGCPSVVTCTPKHEMLRPTGEKVALIDMLPGEEVVVIGKRYSEEQEQVLMGLMLGDGNVANQGTLRVSHCLRQKGYLDWIVDAFSETPAHLGRRKAMSMIDAEFPVTRRTRELRQECYSTGRKAIPDHYWDRLDTLGLSIWLMDDGSFVKRPGKGAVSAYWTIAAMNLTAAERAGADRFFDRIGVDGRWQCVDAGKDQWIWSTAGEEAMVGLTRIVADHIDISRRQEKGWKRWIAEPIGEHSREDALPARIKSIEHIEIPYGRYDITVAGNHNYLLSTGLLVGNTFAKMNGQHPPKAHAEEVEIMRELAFRESRNMAADKVVNGRRIKAQNFGTSTRKKKNGRVDKIYKAYLLARKRALEVLGLDATTQQVRDRVAITSPWNCLIYCTFEISQQVPNCRSAPENAGRPESELCQCRDVVNGVWDNGEPRSFESVCRGRLFRSRGHRSYGENIQLFLQNDRGTYEAQQECGEADSEGAYIKSFSRNKHGLSRFPLDPANGPTYTGTDWGTTDAAGVLYVQYAERQISAIRYDGEPVVIKRGDRIVFAEVYEEGKTSGELGQAAIIRERKLANVLSTITLTIRKRWADLQGAGDRRTWRKMGLPTGRYSTRNFDEHVKEMRGLFDAGRVWVVVDENAFTGTGCPIFCDQLESWTKDENGDEDRSVPQHLCAAARYVFYGMHDIYNDPGALTPEQISSGSNGGVKSAAAPAGRRRQAQSPAGGDVPSPEPWRQQFDTPALRR